MQLTALDWSVIGGYFVINLLIGLWYRKRATGSTGEFFISGRRATWWLAGTSMVATTFAADTPLAVTGLVASYGIAGNWLWWSLLLSNMLTVGSCTVTWLAVTLLTAPEDKPLLLAFYRRIRPNPALWRPIAREAREVLVEHDGWNNLRDWVAGCAMIYLALFGTGKIIFGETRLGLGLLALATLAGVVVYRDLSRRKWKLVSDEAAEPAAPTADCEIERPNPGR